MKDSLVNLLEDFEKLVYKILMWVILVPKTVIKITVDVGFVPDYVRGELRSEKGKQFDEYISPILLYLGVTLLPAIAIFFLRPTGLEIKSYLDDPALYHDRILKLGDGVFVGASDPYVATYLQSLEVNGVQTGDVFENVVGHQMELQAFLTTIADVGYQTHIFEWYAYECGSLNPESGTCMFDVLSYGERHDQFAGVACYSGSALKTEIYAGYQDANQCTDIFSESPTPFNWLPYYRVEILDVPTRNKVKDSFYLFVAPNVPEYKVEVYAISYGKRNEIVESYRTTMLIQPTINDLSITSVNDSYYLRETSVDPILSIFKADGQAGSENEESVSLADRLERGETIFVGLGLLLPPLLFAGAIGLFMAPKPSIGEEALKEHFYAQCYYFAPVGLSFWAWYYTSYFYTQDILLSRTLLVVPFVLALLWFVVVEILSIAETLPSRSKVQAVFIFLGCLLFMGLLVWLGVQFRSNYDWMRESAIWSYFIAGLLLTVGLIYNQTRKLRERRKKKA